MKATLTEKRNDTELRALFELDKYHWIEVKIKWEELYNLKKDFPDRYKKMMLDILSRETTNNIINLINKGGYETK